MTKREKAKREKLLKTIRKEKLVMAIAKEHQLNNMRYWQYLRKMPLSFLLKVYQSAIAQSISVKVEKIGVEIF